VYAVASHKSRSRYRQDEFLAIPYDMPRFGIGPRSDWCSAAGGEEVPVGLAHHQLGMELIGQILGAAEMIGMAVCDEDIFHLRRIEANLPQATFDEGLRFARIVK